MSSMHDGYNLVVDTGSATDDDDNVDRYDDGTPDQDCEEKQECFNLAERHASTRWTLREVDKDLRTRLGARLYLLLRIVAGTVALLAIPAVLPIAARSMYFQNWHVSGYDKAPKSFDAVVSYYNEDYARVSNLTAYIHRIGQSKDLRTKVIVYAKHKKFGEERFREELRQKTGVDEVISVPNLGREGETYLRHIVENYKNGGSNLADHTLFTQAGMMGFGDVEKQESWLSTAMTERFTANVSFLSLAIPGFHHVNFCGISSSGQYWPRLGEISNLIYKTNLCNEHRLISWHGQFIVSRRNILELPLETYKALHEPFHEPAESPFHLNHGSPHCAEMLKSIGGKVDLTRPCWGHYMERSWNMIFRCAQPELAEICRNGGFCGCHHQ